jgi:hypothetical protein
MQGRGRGRMIYGYNNYVIKYDYSFSTMKALVDYKSSYILSTYYVYHNQLSWVALSLNGLSFNTDTPDSWLDEFQYGVRRTVQSKKYTIYFTDIRGHLLKF